MNPKATLLLNNGKKIVIELLPEQAPNTVNSFISLARQGVFDHHRIERVVPGYVVDVSYSAFCRKEAEYQIANEADSSDAHKIRPGVVAMGGYEPNEIAGGEFFFPLADRPEISGKYPVFGKVIEGMEEIRRLEKVRLSDLVEDPPRPVVIKIPVIPEVIVRVDLELYGETYPEPVKLNVPNPSIWPVFTV